MATHHHQTRVPSPTHAPFIPTRNDGATVTMVTPEEFADLLADEAAVIARCSDRPDPIETVIDIAGELARYAVTRAMSVGLAAALIADPFIAPPRQDLPHIVLGTLNSRVGTVFPDGYHVNHNRPSFHISNIMGLDRTSALFAALGYVGSNLTARNLARA